MKTWLRNGMLTATVALLALSGVAQAQVTDNDECSNATLQDDYGFTVHGEFLGLVAAGGPQYFSSPVPIDVVAMTNFDGRGKLVQVDFTVVNGVNPPALPSNVDPQTGFTVNESGQYTVFPDCTGNLELNLPGIFVAAKFVLADQGRKVHSLIYRQHVASPILGCTSSGGCDTLVQSHSDGTKLRRGRERDD